MPTKRKMYNRRKVAHIDKEKRGGSKAGYCGSLVFLKEQFVVG
jgi:hypothetical protein